MFPQAQVQTCIVHMVRHGLRFVPWKHRKQVAADLKAIYRAESTEAAEGRLCEFEEKWDGKYPTISQSWRRILSSRNPKGDLHHQRHRKLESQPAQSG
jgi:putative transposase